MTKFLSGLLLCKAASQPEQHEHRSDLHWTSYSLQDLSISVQTTHFRPELAFPVRGPTSGPHFRFDPGSAESRSGLPRLYRAVHWIECRLVRRVNGTGCRCFWSVQHNACSRGCSQGTRVSPIISQKRCIILSLFSSNLCAAVARI